MHVTHRADLYVTIVLQVLLDTEGIDAYDQVGPSNLKCHAGTLRMQQRPAHNSTAAVAAAAAAVVGQ
jgi:hypothetical protein